jgi:hypothetical protein
MTHCVTPGAAMRRRSALTSARRAGPRSMGMMAAAALLMALHGPSQAAVVVSDLNIFRDFRAANDVGIGAGDLFQFGANISGGSAGYTIQGIFTPANPLLATQFLGVQNCGPLAVNANFCAGAANFSEARTEGSWSIRLANGANALVTPLPGVAAIPAAPVPFPSSVSISANGATPTISWNLKGVSPDSLRVQIFDKTDKLANGTSNIIHSLNLAPGATSYTFPALLNSSTPGKPVALIPGHSYSINFQVIETRNGEAIAPGSGNANILTRSNSFFDFSPPVAGAPPVIELPMVSADHKVYTFKVDKVGPNNMTFIDPVVATGYKYAIGAGDPNFASVLLPHVGDDHFLLHYLFGGSWFDAALDAGIQFFFPAGGVSEFEVGGIEVAAMLDPGNAGAFITGLTFVADGAFTGTMMPVTVDVDLAVPEPMMALLFVTALIACRMTRRKAGAAHGSMRGGAASRHDVLA